MSASVVAVAARRGHHFSKTPMLAITLVAGEGVVGDGHRGTTVKHRSRLVDPTAPNLRQVHLMAAEWLDALGQRGFPLGPADLGENVTTRGLDLLGLAEGTRLRLGAVAEIVVTGLRNPCRQIEDFRPGLLAEMIARAPDGGLIRKAGIMAIVVAGGEVMAGDAITVTAPEGPQRPLRPV